MGKRDKEHRKKVQKRRNRIEQQKKFISKKIQDQFNDLFEKNLKSIKDKNLDDGNGEG